MKQAYLIIILIIIVVIFISINNKNTESFDSMIEKQTLAQCAHKCKVTENCSGIAYNATDGTCYMSNKPLINISDLNSKYINEYTEDQLICNKHTPNDNKENSLSYGDLMYNSTYLCKTDLDKPSEIYFSKDNQFKNVKDFDTLYKTQFVTPYQIRKYDWEKEKYSDEMYIDKEIFLRNLLVTDYDHILDYKSKLINNSKEYDDITNNINDEFVEYDKFNIGDYLYPYQCINDTNVKKCMMLCKENNDCVAFEHNTELKRFNKSVNEQDELTDLCCMKKNIGPFVNRDKEYDKYKNGKFYLKSKYHPLET